MIALFSRKKEQPSKRLYASLVARARHPAFFLDGGVPDTFDGRFEMMVMHLYLVHARLKDDGPNQRQLSQQVFDAFLDDMDAALREAAVGDQTVPKRIAKMTRVFYGRTGAFDNVLEADIDRLEKSKRLAEVIARNLFPDEEHFAGASVLAGYMLEERERLAQLQFGMSDPVGEVFQGEPDLSPRGKS